MQRTGRAVLAFGFWLALVGVQGAAEQRYWLASQQRWQEKDGFYLNFECKRREGETLCHLADVGLFLGAADGSVWRFARAEATWELGRDYAVRAVLGSTACELWLDGVPAGVNRARGSSASSVVTASTGWSRRTAIPASTRASTPCRP